MKKIMIAVAIVCATVFAHGAVVIWNSGTFSGDGKGGAVAANSVTAYLWEISAADYTTYSAMDAATISKTIGGLYDKGEIPASFTADGSGNTVNKKGAVSVGLTGTIDHGAGTTAYGIILFKDNTNAGYYMANVASAAIEGAQNVTIGNLASTFKGAAGGATSWQSVAAPEPTSGLLLLLGMAGLALKRKRA